MRHRGTSDEDRTGRTVRPARPGRCKGHTVWEADDPRGSSPCRDGTRTRSPQTRRMRRAARRRRLSVRATSIASGSASGSGRLLLAHLARIIASQSATHAQEHTMSRSKKPRYSTRSKFWKDTVLASRSQKRAWSTRKQIRTQQERMRAKTDLRRQIEES